MTDFEYCEHPSLEYCEHPSLTAQWSDGQLLPVPESAAATDTVWVANAGDAETWEGLLATPVGDEQWRLCAVPGFAYGISFGDVVRTIRSGEGVPVVTGIDSPSDNATFRLYVESPADGEVIRRAAEFAQAGCLVDCLGQKVIAISCPSSLAPEIADRLSALVTGGGYLFESGRA